MKRKLCEINKWEVLMGFIIDLIISVVVASVCSTVATNKHRSGVGWFIAGLIFGFWTLLVIVLLGDPTQVKNSPRNGSSEYNRYKYEDYD